MCQRKINFISREYRRQNSLRQRSKINNTCSWSLLHIATRIATNSVHGTNRQRHTNKGADTENRETYPACRTQRDILVISTTMGKKIKLQLSFSFPFLFTFLAFSICLFLRFFFLLYPFFFLLSLCLCSVWYVDVINRYGVDYTCLMQHWCSLAHVVDGNDIVMDTATLW